MAVDNSIEGNDMPHEEEHLPAETWSSNRMIEEIMKQAGRLSVKLGEYSERHKLKKEGEA